MTITAVVGSRSVTSYNLVKSILSRYSISRIVSGGAKGVDLLSEKYSAEVGLPTPHIFKPDWDKFGKSAGFIRNKDIVDNADFVIAIWDGESKGTVHSIEYSFATNKPIDVWLVQNNQANKME